MQSQPTHWLLMVTPFLTTPLLNDLLTVSGLNNVTGFVTDWNAGISIAGSTDFVDLTAGTAATGTVATLLLDGSTLKFDADGATANGVDAVTVATLTGVALLWPTPTSLCPDSRISQISAPPL